MSYEEDHESITESSEPTEEDLQDYYGSFNDEVDELPARKRIRGKQLRRWAFTINARDDLPLVVGEEGVRARLIKELKVVAKAWIFQLEQAPTTGTYHYQGRFSLPTGMRLGEQKSRFPEFGKYMHITPECTGNEEASAFYSMKEDSRKGGPWHDKDEARYVPKSVRDITLNDFQSLCTSKIEGQDDRKVLFVIDVAGNTGKSTLVRYLCCRKGALRVPPTMRSAHDMIQFIFGQVTQLDKVHTIVLDIPRSHSKTWDSYLAALETLKDGYVYDQRYTAKNKYMEPPKLLVLCNEKPPRHHLSDDRWSFVYMDAGEWVYTEDYGEAPRGESPMD